MHQLKRKLVSRLYRFLIAVYYQLIIGRQVPFARKFTKLVNSWEKQLRRGDIPQSREAWEYQYRVGRWNYMKQFDQLARYSVIVGYLQHYKPGSDVLDVGCGEGILLGRLGRSGYSKYMGLDISETAIERSSQGQNERALFIQANAEDYVPTESFDAIVFNEILYYLNDPLQVVKRYTHVLNEGGVFIVSTHAISKRAVSILEMLKDTYILLDEVKTVHSQKSNAWICSVFTVSSTCSEESQC